jgi:hypothetical protein
VTQQCEAGAPVHLSFDQLGLGVDSLGSSVVKGSVSAAVTAWMSRSRPLVKECRKGRSASRALVIHRWSPASFSRAEASIPAKEPIRAVRAVISGQAASRRARVSAWPPVRRSGLVSRMRAARRGDRCGRSPSRRPWLT